MASTLLEPSSLASMAVRSFVLLILTAGIALAFRRRSAAFLHGVWTVGLAGCLAIPVIMSLSLNWTLPVLPSQTIPEITTPASVGMSQAAHMPVSHRLCRSTMGSQRNSCSQ